MTTESTSRVAALSEAKRALLEQLRKGQRGGETTIPRRANGDALPLSFAQQRLWFIHQMDPASPAYHVPTALRLRGELDTAVLGRSLREIVRRHESLRTRFTREGDLPAQLVEPAGDVDLAIVDLQALPPTEREAAAERLAMEEAATPFDLERGPLLRARLLRLAPDDHVFLVTMHHIVSDGWSMGVFVREMAELYGAFARGRAPALPEVPIQYGDFARWQRETFVGERLEAELAYWRDRLTPLPPSLELPADRPRPPVQTFRGGAEALSIGRDVAESIRRLARREGATLFMALLAAFDALLCRLTGETDLALGTGVANRTLPELEPLIGFFVNTLVLRVSCAGDPAFTELLGRAKETTLGAYAHQDLPFERLVEEIQPARDLSRNPLFQVAIALQNAPLEDFEISSLSVTPVSSPSAATRFDLELHLWENGDGGLDGYLFRSADLFDAATARRIAERYAAVLAQVAQDPARRLSELDVLTPADRATIATASRGSALAVGATPVIELFEERVAQAGGAPALDDGVGCLSYRELDERAARLAARLRRAGVGPEDRVAVLADRSIEQVVGVVAVAKARAAWVPLDPANPDDRLAAMLERSGARAVLVAGAHRRRVADERPVFRIDQPDDADLADGAGAATPPPPRLHAESLAYVIFTSGSSGEPNGVEVSQANLANLVAWHREAFDVTERDRATLIAGVGFDASVWEVWPYLAAGACLCVPDDAVRLHATALRDWLVQRGVTIAFLPTPLAELVLPLEWPRGGALRILLTGGDRLHLVDAAALPFRVVNDYGPTETTVVATSGDADSGASLPWPTLGRPIANARAYVLDAHLRPVPPGVTGELWVGGAGVARGYAGRADLTAERFLPDPSAAEPGARMYRTGDRVRGREDGRLEFLGRADAQVKIRGVRVEPGEVEAALARCPLVESAAVLARADEGETALVAYVVPRRRAADRERWHAEHLARWRDLYDTTYRGSGADVDPSFNIVGWDSSYTGEPIPEDEMREWRDETVARILALGPERVLEIGCGTGLLLTRIAPHVARYVATDLSPVSLELVRRTIAARGDLARVELFERAADDHGGFEAESFDTVILNSVVQYFPDAPYLERVLEGAMRLAASGGRIFVGDVRDARLHAAFATSLTLHGAARSRSLGDVRRRARRARARDEELLVAPALFADVARREPRGAWACALLKRGRADNELTRFRYDVVIEVGRAMPEPPEVELDGARRRPADLERRLAEGASEVVLRAVPNVRVVRHVSDARAVERADEGMTVGDLPSAGGAAEHPDDFREIAARHGYEALAGPSRGGEHLFDVSFVRQGRLPAALAVPSPEPGAGEPLATEPLRLTSAGALVPELREWLAERLTDALVPASFVMLDEMPWTPNGKIDRRALPAPEGAVRPAGPRVAPRTPTEKVIARIWADVLGIERISATDDFFGLGGHSLMAAQVLSRLQRALGVDVPLRAIFEAPTVEALAAVVDARGPQAAPGTAAPIPRLEPHERVPLSLAQQRLWFIDRLEPGVAAYHIPSALRLDGDLNVRALSRALAEIVVRHEALRTRFQDGPDGPVQKIDAPREAMLEVEDVPGASAAEREAEARRRVEHDALAPFDLERGPMLRAKLLRLGPRDHVLSLVVHHIAADGWSMGLLVKELSALYAAFASGAPSPLPALPLQYADWAVWQRAWLAAGELDRQLAFWRAELQGVAPLALPTDRPRPPHPTYAGEALDLELDAECVARLTRVARERNATLHMALLAAVAAVLGRWSRQEDFAVGTPVAGRRRPETEALIGFFVNTLAVRMRLDGRGLTYSELVARVREATLSSYANQDVPFERIVEEVHPDRDTSRNPVFQVLFALHNVPFGELTLPGLSLRSFGLETQTAQFDLEVSLFDGGGPVQGQIRWSTDLFERPTMERFAEHLRRVLARVAENPDVTIAEATSVPEAERAFLLEEVAGARRDWPLEPDLASVFEAQADRTPNACALRSGGDELTYAELDARANRLANLLVQRGVARDTLVGLCLARGLDLVAAVLAVRKAGAAYVPLDPAYPNERLALMIEDSALRVVVTTSDLARALPRLPSDVANALPTSGVEILSLDRATEELRRSDASRLARPSLPEELVYVVYTSGSTGRPKGIAMRQDALRNLIAWQRERSGAKAGRRTLQYASLSFDVSFQEIFATFAEGGTLVMVSEEERRDPSALLRVLAAERIERLFLPFVALESLAEAAEDHASAPALREVITAGERLRVTPTIRRLFERLPGATLDNQYGPSEAHVVTGERLEGKPSDWPALPAIGRPVANTRVLVLDDALEPVPLGAIGEIFVGGVGLARGYAGRPDLTADRFVPDPHRVGERLYRTGDLGRVRPDGRVEFHGRRDRQLKVRGFRVEPSEIEAAIARVEGVRAVAVDAPSMTGSESRLTAWVVPDGTLAGRVGTLRTALARTLPDYLVPSAFVELVALPLTASGKVDRARLPAPAPAAEEREERAALSPLEALVASTFEYVLGAKGLGRGSHFFDSGGHSLLATRVVARLRRVAGVDVPLRAVFEAPTVRELAAVLGAALRAEPSPGPIPRSAPGSRAPLSFQQERLWFLDRLDPGGAGYVISAGLDLRGDLDRPALERALAALAQRHETLRTRFESDEGRPLQVVDPPRPLPLEHVDVRGAADPEEELRARLEAEALAPFDLERGPLWRAILVRVAPDRHAFVLSMHHIVTDGWSMGILVRELGTLYDGFRAGKDALTDLAELPIRYADYAVWQRSWLAGGELERQLGYWRAAIGDVEPLELPTDRSRPPVLGHRGQRVRIEADAALTSRLRDLARAEGATLHMVLLSAYALVLSRWSGRDDFAIGVPVANRTREETEGLIGYFVNTLALRVDLRAREGGTSAALVVRDLLARVRETSLGAYANQDVPFESLLELLRPHRDLSRSPIFQVWFNLVNVPQEDARFGALEALPLGVEATESRFDLSLYAFETGDTLLLDAIGPADLFDAWRLRELLDQMLLALGQMADDPDQPLEEISLVTVRASGDLPDPAAPLSDGWRGSVPALFAAHARAHPSAPAILGSEGAWTYGDLEDRANRLAQWLGSRGIAHGDAVAIWAHRSAPTVCAMLGVLKAGAATVLLDPAHPAARLVACLRAARVRAMIEVEAAGPPPAAVVECVRELGAAQRSLPGGGEEIDRSLRDFAPTPPDVDGAPEDVACITFTSGSEGVPKAVRGGHGSLTHFQPILERRFALVAGDRFSMLSGLAHDPLQRDVFTPLLRGAAICVPSPDDLDPRRLAAWVASAGVTVMCLTPALASILAGHPTSPSLARVRLVFSLGEQLTRRDVRRLQAIVPNATIVNLYGTTETQRAVGHFVIPPGEPLRAEDGSALEHEIIPAGVGFEDVQLLVRREGGRAAGLGELGEIWIRSPHLALGYVDEALTRERFVGTGPSRAYRTGDLGRYLPGGAVRVAGRRDSQVNVRGFRVELGEVEAALAAHPDVGDAVAGLDAEGRLAGWVTPRGARRPSGRDVREAARARVPEHMLPWSVVVIDAIPLTPNGKVDRRALPAPSAPAAVRGAAPRSPEEEIACALFAEVLGLERVGVADDFFALGGHSLLAVRLLSRANAALKVDLPLRALFETPTPAGLARIAVAAARLGRAPAEGIRPAPECERRKLSFAQQRLWFFDRLEPGSAAYNLASALELIGDLDVAALARAFDEIERRHESLRTRFVAGPDGPEQIFDPPGRRALETFDLSASPEPPPALASRLAADARRPFDLEHGPLWRARLFRVAERKHVLSLALHHIVTDGWSMETLVRELSALYAAYAEGRESPLPDATLQYADWAAWQRAWLEGGELERQLAYWKEELEGAAPLELPTDRPRPPRRGLRGASVALELPAEDATALARLARAEGATLFHALLGTWQALLARFSGMADVVVGTPVANRSAPEAEGLVGFFANTLALRSHVDPRRSFRHLLRAVREKTLDAQAHQDVPFEVVVDAVGPERDLSRNPLFDAMFVLRHGERDLGSPGSLRVEPFPVETGATAFDVTLVLGEAQGRIFGSLEYDADLFEPATGERLAAYFGVLVHEIVGRPDVPLGSLDLRSPAERALVDEMNRTGARLAGRTLETLIAERAARAPDDVAVLDEEVALTYAELERRAEGIARRLRRAGVRCETTVGLLAGRGASAIAAMLGIWKSGGVYVPLDASQPRERLAAMLRDAHVRVLLAERGLESALPEPRPTILPLDGEDAAGEDGAPVEAGVDPRNAAYVIFTSGSTGEPKGVVVEHGPIAARVEAQAAAHGFRPGERSLHFLPLPFDASLHEILTALVSGATLVVHPDPRGETPGDLLVRCERAAIAVADLPPGFLHEMAEDLARSGGTTPPSLRRILTGGEAPRAALVAKLLRAGRAGLELWNAYGPTEAVIDAIGGEVTLEESSRDLVPLGRPLVHSAAYLLDAQLHPVPIGAVGEIFVGGPVLARGYVARPAQTAEVFLPDPFASETGARMYRTGDLARRLGDGRLVFVGRRDAQVKVRGFRVELGEIESALASVPGVVEAVVTMRGEGAEKRLVAHFASPEGNALDADVVRAALRERLPEYMIPADVVRLDALPRTRTGKVDRRALPTPDAARRHGVRVAPRDDVERDLASLWGETLRLADDEVDVEESFFAAGGNSLLAIRLVASIRRRLGVELPVAAIFREPTLAGLARTLHAGAPTDHRGAAKPVAALVRLRADSSGAPLVCFPAIGGGVSDFAQLARRLDRPVWGVPAIDALAGSIEEAAAAGADAIVCAVPEGPVHLLGWSYGALVAFETARHLEAAGREVGALLLVDAPAPGAGEAAADPPLPGAGAALPPELTAEDAARWLEGLAARRDAIRRYRPRLWSGHAVVVRGTDSTAGRLLDASLGWSALVSGAVDVAWVPGSHDSLLTGEGAGAVAALVERYAARASREAS
ncbi:MAG: amino acid adenylation domain-containing protein [bacterium]